MQLNHNSLVNHSASTALLILHSFGIYVSTNSHSKLQQSVDYKTFLFFSKAKYLGTWIFLLSSVEVWLSTMISCTLLRTETKNYRLSPPDHFSASSIGQQFLNCGMFIFVIHNQLCSSGSHHDFWDSALGSNKMLGTLLTDEASFIVKCWMSDQCAYFKIMKDLFLRIYLHQTGSGAWLHLL